MKYDDYILERTPEEYKGGRRHHVEILAQRAKREGNLSQDKLYRGERGMDALPVGLKTAKAAPVVHARCGRR